MDRPLTGRANLVVHARLWGLSNDDAQRRIGDVVDAFGLREFIDRPVDTYSGGQRRRLEVARALLSEPEVLFLDEPTIGLDPRMRHELLDLIAGLRSRSDMTILLTTHHLDEAEELCDRVAILHDGQIVALHSPSALLAAIGHAVLELRIDGDGGTVLRALQARGVGTTDMFAVGSTVYIPLNGDSGPNVAETVTDLGFTTRATSTRRPTLDDIYLQLTGNFARQLKPPTRGRTLPHDNDPSPRRPRTGRHPTTPPTAQYLGRAGHTGAPAPHAGRAHTTRTDQPVADTDPVRTRDRTRAGGHLRQNARWHRLHELRRSLHDRVPGPLQLHVLRPGRHGRPPQRRATRPAGCARDAIGDRRREPARRRAAQQPASCRTHGSVLAAGRRLSRDRDRRLVVRRGHARAGGRDVRHIRSPRQPDPNTRGIRGHDRRRRLRTVVPRGFDVPHRARCRLPSLPSQSSCR